MDELRNLQELAKCTLAEFESYKGEDFVLPQVFKDQVKEINNNKLIYNKYSARIETAGYQNGNLNIYLPNQWFFIASYFTDYYNELQLYKKVALRITTKERLKGLNGNDLTLDEKSLLNSLDLSEISKGYLVSFITDYSWWGGAKTIDRGDFYVSPILSLAKLVNASQSFVADLCAFLADKQALVNAIIQGEKDSTVTNNVFTLAKVPLQQIYYGAPGTGKSHIIKELTKGAEVIRTTFHPDSDYSTFVGAYKPTMGLLPICDELGQPMKIGSTVLHKEQIVYKFVDQAFLQAYVKAWKFYAEANGETPKNQYLIIEEINRGNCAQIFGDLFQLLDRNRNGFSEYPINADKDLQNQLAQAFKGMAIAQADEINAYYNGEDIVGKVLKGEILLLPNNLYIWATMNTSDQSLFPIDSAFKRRWDWQYMPIGKGYDNNGNEYKWFVEIAGKKYSWWSFLEKINAQIAEATQSEDKKLGFFFCKAEDNKISAERFVGKVIFYLWNDVFKDYGFERDIFKDIDGTELSFAKFYRADINGNAIIQEDKVEVFLNNLKVELLDSADSTEDEEDDDGNKINTPSTGRDYTKYSINGIGAYGKNRLAVECVKKYIELNPLKTADEVMNEWLSLGNIVPHFIESKEQYEARTDNSKRSLAVQCGDTILYVAHDGYGSNGKVLVLKDAVNNKDWGLTIDEV